MNLLVALLCCNTCGLLSNKLIDNSSPKVVIVGAGPAGIAAATRLLENGFTDVTILEAENRIGGRIHSIKLGDYMVDMGAQWVHGEENNVAFDLAWPLGLLERSEENDEEQAEKFFGSSGIELSFDLSRRIDELVFSLLVNVTDIDNLETGSFGEFAELKFAEYFKAHPEIREDIYEPILHSINLEFLSTSGADSWFDVSARGIRDIAQCDGDHWINWKNRTYSTILDILMKKYPNPEEELPVVENTRMNNKVTKINYNNEGYDTVKISTANGKEYLADHVIFTPSLGVLKANYQQLFNPPLPLKKVKAIENIGYGHTAKIWLYYENPWWSSDGDLHIAKPVFWTEKDFHEIECDSDKRWMTGLLGVIPVEHKPKLLCLWTTSDYSIEMELIPEEIFRSQILEFLDIFYGHAYNITEPTKIKRTSWNTNENFLGTYSYVSLATDMTGVNYTDLAEPIMLNNKLTLQFAGEGTSEHYATVHGAIESGWREADRLIDLYSKREDPSSII